MAQTHEFSSIHTYTSSIISVFSTSISIFSSVKWTLNYLRGRQNGPQWSLTPGVTLLCGSLPWVWTGPSNLPLTNRIGQRWCDITSKMRWQKPVSFIFLAFSSSLFPTCSARWSHLPCHEPLSREVYVARNPGRPLVHSERWSEFCQQPHKWAGRGVFSSQAFERPRARGPR